MLKQKHEEAASFEDAHAIKSALEYLYVEAMAADIAEAIGLRHETPKTNGKPNGANN